MTDEHVNLPGRDAPARLSDYDAERAQFRVEVPELFNPVIDILERWAADDPDALALVTLGPDGGLVASHSVGALVDEAQRMARGWQVAGLKKGERVFVMLPRSVEWYVVMLGAMRIGAVPLPAPNMLTTKDIGQRLARADVAAAVVDAAGAAKMSPLSDELPELRVVANATPAAGWRALEDIAAGGGGTSLDASPTTRDDPLLIYFTSGTVGLPKMVEHDQSYALGHIGTARFWHDLRQGDRHWTVSDTGWAKAAWGGMFGQWHERATVVQAALDRPDAHAILEIIERHKITSFCAPPTLYRQLVLADFSQFDLSSLRHCTSAGEPLNPEIIRAWEKGTGLAIYDGYGQTESTVMVANYRAIPIKPGSMGKPVPGYEITIRNDDGEALPDGAVGNIAIRREPRPVGLFQGYWRDEKSSAERLRGDWYYSGDLGRRDADGYFWFEGRDDDIITSSAYRIGPFEVESVLIEHPAVAEAGVVRKPDPERTEIVCAFLVLAPGHVPSAALSVELQRHAKRETAPYKYPREIIYVRELHRRRFQKNSQYELSSIVDFFPYYVLKPGDEDCSSPEFR